MGEKENFIVDPDQEYLELSKFMGSANVSILLKLDVTDNGKVRVRKVTSGGELDSWTAQPDLIPHKELREWSKIAGDELFKR